MPKKVIAKKGSGKSKVKKDDLDLDEDEEEEEEEEEEETEDTDDDDEEEEESEEEDDDEDEDEDEEEEDDDDEEEEPAPKKRGRPKGSKNSKTESVDGSLGIVLLRTGVPKKVEIVKVMGKNVKIKKPGDKNAPAFRIPVTDVRLYDEETFEKMQEIAEKITTLSDKNTAIFTKLSSVQARKVAKKGSPLDEF